MIVQQGCPGCGQPFFPISGGRAGWHDTYCVDCIQGFYRAMGYAASKQIEDAVGNLVPLPTGRGWPGAAPAQPRPQGAQKRGQGATGHPRGIHSTYYPNSNTRMANKGRAYGLGTFALAAIGFLGLYSVLATFWSSVATGAIVLLVSIAVVMWSGVRAFE